MTDVNVTVKVADRIARARGYVQGACVEEHYRDAREALAALSDPEVLAGVAGVLREHGDSRQSAGGFLLVCRCGDAVDDLARHQTTALADWLRGTDDPTTPVAVYDEEET